MAQTDTETAAEAQSQTTEMESTSETPSDELDEEVMATDATTSEERALGDMTIADILEGRSSTDASFRQSLIGHLMEAYDTAVTVDGDIITIEIDTSSLAASSIDSELGVTIQEPTEDMTSGTPADDSSEAELDPPEDVEVDTEDLEDSVEDITDDADDSPTESETEASETEASETEASETEASETEASETETSEPQVRDTETPEPQMSGSEAQLDPSEDVEVDAEDLEDSVEDITDDADDSATEGS